MYWPGVALVALVATSLISGQLQHPHPHQHPQPPNIIFILTDDQDLHMDSLSYMPHLKTHISERGTTFTKHYCTVALCCPSRVSLWTGKAAHNTNVTDVNPPYGRSMPSLVSVGVDCGVAPCISFIHFVHTLPSPFMTTGNRQQATGREGREIPTYCLLNHQPGGYPKFVSQGLNSAYLPIWLQSLGYATYYVGKLFNAHSVDNYASPRPAAWTGSEFLLDPYTYEYLNATFVRDAGHPQSYEGQYSTDVIAAKAFGYLDAALHASREESTPFFLTIAPTAPHSNVHMNTPIDGNFSEGSNTQSPPIPAARHSLLFPDVVVPRTPHFNPAHGPHGVSWISRLARQNQTNVAFNDHFYRARLRALQAVDEMIDGLFRKLDAAGVTEETYVFFSTDNGYHIGQHRLQPGKQCAFEEDVNIPFMVRGPGVPRNATTGIVTTHTDLAPTFVRLAGGDVREDFDGQVIPLHGLVSDDVPGPPPSSVIVGEGESEDENSNSTSPPSPLVLTPASAPNWSTEHVNIESWGVIMSEGDHGAILYPNHTYKALRLIAADYSYLYTVWCSGEHELYDLKTDRYEMHNLFSPVAAATTPGLLHHQHQHHQHQTSLEVGGGLHGFEAQAPLLLLEGEEEEEEGEQVPEKLRGVHDPSQQQQWQRQRLIARLDALLMVLKTCRARACTHPWEVLHPPVVDVDDVVGDGGGGGGGQQVRSLAEAMAEEYDEFYASQQKVAYGKCEKGYILESEGPGEVVPYGFDVGA
jgi:arylsulfatase A-like enzyme